ncbi:MAG TPA: DUF3617 family protein [Burkholderiales bacterium]|nr:DUF3617 family protein [Burkholderiales bacterium]
MAAASRAALLALLAALPFAARADVLPGEWDIATTVSVSGQAGSVGPLHQTRCLDATQAANPGALFGPLAGAGAGCSLSDKRDNGSSLSFHLTCIGPFAADGSGTVSYGPDRMDGELQLRSSIAGQQFDTRSHVAAHRIGPCQ